MSASIQFLNTTTINLEASAESIIKLLMENRHITDPETFLQPPFPLSPIDPSPLVYRIKTFLTASKNILIYGDYDVDGLTSTAILWQTLYSLSPTVFPFIPHREIDGYGFKASSFFRLESAKNLHFDLLITVDNGIVADKEFAKLKEKYPDMTIIVVDHHLPDGKLKHADLLFHSTDTSASALAWFLSQEFDRHSDMSLAALGLVADCQPLIGLNRSLVVHGLKEMTLNPSPGIKKLMDISGVKKDKLSVYDLSFLLAPRLNAVGRLSDPTDALRLLCSQNSLQAGKYATILNNYNQERQALQKESVDLADQSFDPKNKLIFIADKFNPGIIGLIAGRLTEKYLLPSVIISQNGEVAKASCRSIPEVNIIEVLRKFSELFIDLGGHPGAAGFSILDKNIPKLGKKLNQYFSKKLANYQAQKTLTVDAKMELDAVTLKNIKLIKSLAPFGIANPEPLFLFENLSIESKRLLGQNQDHLKLKVNGVDAIAFKKGNLASDLNLGDTVNLVAHLDLNEWNGHTFPQLIVKEIIKQ